MKHLPFDSIYRANFEVLEERQGRIRCYPHSAQLPLLLRALNQEFYNALPPRIARVDHRGSAFDKIVLQNCALVYCSVINAARTDEVRMFGLYDHNLVCRPTIVQQVTEEHPKGRFHRFRFYGGPNFFPEVYANGKTIAFSEHVLQQFAKRTKEYEGEDFTNLLTVFYGAPMIAMPVGPGRAFVVGFDEGILAFPYKETANQYFVTSCLTINEITSMQTELPPQTINLHYDLPYYRPKMRTWHPDLTMKGYFERWDRKAKTITEPMKEEIPFTWKEVAYHVRDVVIRQGHGPGSKIVSTDFIPGPDVETYLPGEPEICYDELDFYKKTHPKKDWDAIFAERVKAGTLPPSAPEISKNH